MVRSFSAFLGAGLLALAAAGALAQTAPPVTRGCIVRAPLDGIVTNGMASYLESAIEAAAEARCEAVLVTIDTPGGLLDATRHIVRVFLGSSVPVITYVTPSGARAGSAGVFITMAGHVAAMSPGSNIGAAHPVVGMGRDPEESGEHMAKKIVEDTAAFARGIAERRERNADWAEQAVRESVSITAREAAEKNVVDLLAGSEGELLAAIHGREVQVGDRAIQLATRDAEIRDHAMTIRQRVLIVLGNPTLTYVLMMIGVLGILLEVYNPGMIVPGVIGASALLLAAIGLNALPVNLAAILLLVIAVGLFVAELFVSSFGLLTVGGLAALLLGASLLVDRADPDFFADASVRVSWGVVVPSAVVIAGALGALAFETRRTWKRRATTGAEDLVDAEGVALTDVSGDGGRVRVRGESWRAVATGEPIAEGSKVRVLEIDGLTLKVRADVSFPVSKSEGSEA